MQMCYEALGHQAVPQSKSFSVVRLETTPLVAGVPFES